MLHPKMYVKHAQTHTKPLSRRQQAGTRINLTTGALVSDNAESLLTRDTSLGKASLLLLALPFDDSLKTHKAESDKETANFFWHSNEA